MSTARAPRLDHVQTLSLLALLAALLLPHAPHLPGWLIATLAVLFVLRAALLLTQRALPPRWLVSVLAVGLSVAVFLEFRTLLGKTGGVALLAALVGAKLMETRSRRDALLLVYLGYFLVVTNFLFTQSLWMAAYLFGAVWGATALLIGWNAHGGWTGRPERVWAHVRLALSLMAQALPLMALLFVFFPRIEGPLWRLPQDRGAAQSGLADSMSPGSFSNMVQNDEVAFRVRFEGSAPPQGELYWRGPVFEDYDGHTWTQGVQNPATPAPDTLPQGPLTRYTITLEPHQRHWLLALDLPATTPDGTRLTDRLQLVAQRPITQRSRFELSAALRYSAGRQTAPDTRMLTLPEGFNPRTVALAQGWRSLPVDERINQALRTFPKLGVRYSLTPPRYGRDAVDEFLFKGREGFCEHFAGSFVVMMRAAGVPARVVGGYQGGEMNPSGHYLIVRQADAHAWAEVWLEDRGWVRVDPTYAVAPERIDHGLSRAVDAEALPMMVRPDEGWIKQARLALDAAVHTWNQWVIGYTPERQRELLKRIGIGELWSSQFVLGVMVCTALLIAPLAGWLLWCLRPPRPEPARAAFDALCNKLARIGLPRQPAEAAGDYARRVAAARPDLGEAVLALVREYEALRYGPGTPDPAALATFKRGVARFRVKRTAG